MSDTEICQKELIARGEAYPRSCPLCGLTGPCLKGYGSGGNEKELETQREAKHAQDEADLALGRLVRQGRANINLFPPHKCGLYLTHNEHKDDYQDIETFIENHDLAEDFASAEAMHKAIDANELWVLQWYPETPIGFLRVAAPTLEEALKAAGIGGDA